METKRCGATRDNGVIRFLDGEEYPLSESCLLPPGHEGPHDSRTECGHHRLVRRPVIRLGGWRDYYEDLQVCELPPEHAGDHRSKSYSWRERD